MPFCLHDQTHLGASPLETPADSKAWLSVASKAALLALPLLGTACTTRSELGFATLMKEVPATQAVIVPPPGGPSIVAVLQRSYRNGISQEIALSTASLTPGQNAFYVSLGSGTSPQTEIDDVLTSPALMQDRIQTEMEERLPGIEMQTSLVYVQNRYGPFGFATGRTSTGDVCLYAWQRIEPNEPAILVSGGVISIRLRLCDAAATQEQLLRSMYGFTISAHDRSGSWNPYGSPPPVPEQLGGIDAPVYPLGMNSASGVAVLRERRVQVRSSPARRVIDTETVVQRVPAPPPASAAQESLSTPQPGYPVVPPPSSVQ